MTCARPSLLDCLAVVDVEFGGQVEGRMPRQIMKVQIVMKQLKEVGGGN